MRNDMYRTWRTHKTRIVVCHEHVNSQIKYSDLLSLSVSVSFSECDAAALIHTYHQYDRADFQIYTILSMYQCFFIKGWGRGGWNRWTIIFVHTFFNTVYITGIIASGYAWVLHTLYIAQCIHLQLIRMCGFWYLHMVTAIKNKCAFHFVCFLHLLHSF